VSIARVTIEMPATSPPASSQRAAAGTRGGLSLLAAALVTFAVWRGTLYGFDLLGLSLTPSMGGCRKQWQVFGNAHPFLNGFFRWDSGWYMAIAQRGYSYRPESSSSVAFYPLVPYLARYLGQVVGGVPVAALVIANTATVGAIYYLRRLGALLYGDEVGRLASILLLVFPTSLFLSAFYTEGPFVCLAAASMYYFFRERFVCCGVLGCLAMLTRSTGLLLFAAYALDLVVRLHRRELTFSWRMLALLLIPAGLGLFMLIQYVQVGDPLAFSKTMKHWGRHAAWPWAGIVDALRGTDFSFPVNFAKTQRFIDALFALAFLGIGATMALRKQRVVLWAYVILGMLLPLSTYALAGMNRYSLGLFPAFIFLAQLCQNRPALERWLIYVSSLFLAVYSLRFMQCGWVG
jgi:hypothetical protein